MKPYFHEDGIAIFLGDCREVLPTLAQVDHLITDPPYSKHTHEKQRVASRSEHYEPSANGSALSSRRKSESTISRYRDLGFDSLPTSAAFAVGREMRRLVRRWALVFTDAENQRLWQRAFERGGLQHVRVGAWVKPNSTPQFTGDRPATAFEAIEIAHQPGRKRWNGGGKHGIWYSNIVQGNDREPRLHTTQKPLALMKALVEDFTDPGDTILDPFAGSGTTGRAAKDLGRRAILIEREEKYAEIAAKRMAQGVLFPAPQVASHLRCDEHGNYWADGANDPCPKCEEISV